MAVLVTQESLTALRCVAVGIWIAFNWCGLSSVFVIYRTNPSILDEKKFFKNPWNQCYFVKKKISNKSPKTIWVYLVPRYAAKFLKNIFYYFFNTIGIRINSRYAHALWFLAYFVPNFLLIIFLKTTKIYLVPPTLKIAKTAEKSSILADLSIHYLFDISGTHYNYNFGLFCSKSWTYHFSQVQLGQSGPAYA